MKRTVEEAAVELEKICFIHSWSENAIRESLEKPWNHLILMDEGYLIYSLAAGEAELLRIGVKPEMRRQGVGKKLFSRMLQELKKEQAEKLFLEVRAGNAAAIPLYRGFGMKELGRRKDYYQDPVEDAILFTLAFSEVQPL